MAQITTTCGDCGEQFTYPARKANQRPLRSRCDDCQRAHRTRAAREKRRRAAAARTGRSSIERTATRSCERCGAEYEIADRGTIPTLCPSCRSHDRKAKAAVYNARNRERSSSHWRNWELSRDDVDQIIAGQSGCAICHTRNPGPHGWHVDHDHDTGEMRALLCHNCNVGIGLLGDDWRTLEAAANYLDGWEALHGEHLSHIRLRKGSGR